jgi:hypothetical protein
MLARCRNLRREVFPSSEANAVGWVIGDPSNDRNQITIDVSEREFAIEMVDGWRIRIANNHTLRKFNYQSMLMYCSSVRVLSLIGGSSL